MEDRRGAAVDALVYGASAAYAAGIAAVSTIPLQEAWGRMAVWPYAAGALATVALAFGAPRLRPAARLRLRIAVAGAVLAAAVLAPVGVQIALRDARGPATHAQSETVITEEAARALLRGENPYVVDYVDGPLRTWPVGVKTHFPYLPAMVPFGLPRGVAGPEPWADARVAFLLVTLVATFLAVRRMPRARAFRTAQLLLLAAPSAVAIAGGGDDVTVLSLLLLALVLIDRYRPVAGAVVGGLAAAMKATAWPLLPVLALAARRRDGRNATGTVFLTSGVVLAAVVLPFVAWDAGAFVEDTLLFALGLANDPTLSESPTLGRALVDGFEVDARAMAAVAAASSAGTGAWLMLTRRPVTGSDAAGAAAVVLAIAILLAPAGRFGYLLYPFELAAWARLLGDFPRVGSTTGRWHVFRERRPAAVSTSASR